MSNNTRENNYDLLRVFAACSVILLHVNAFYFIDVAETPSFSMQYVAGSLINIITRFSVPSFFMLSGAFVLSKEKNKDPIYFYHHSLYKLFLPLVIITAIVAAKDIIIDSTSVKTALIAIAQGSYNNSWFMCVLAGLYLATPFIITLRNSINGKWFDIISVVILFWGMISQITSSYHVAYTLGNISSYLGYFLIGNVIYEKSKMNTSRVNNIMIVLAGALAITIAFIARFQGVKTFLFATHTSFFSPAIIIFSLCVFWLVSGIKVKKDYSKLGRLTFYVYLFHRTVYLALTNLNVVERFPFLSKVAIITVVTTIISYIISWIFYMLYDELFLKKVKQ